jgi:hypothetical protein
VSPRVDLDAAEARAKAAAAEGYGGEWCWDGGTLVDEDHDEAVGISRDRAAPTSAGAHIAGMDPPTTLVLAAELRAARNVVGRMTRRPCYFCGYGKHRADCPLAAYDEAVGS